MSHRDVVELLPWYVNATLTEPERRAVESHLPACDRCAQEVEELKTIQAVTREAALPAPDPGGLARALARIEQEEQSREPAWRRLGAWWEAARSGWAALWGPVPIVARVALAAQLGLILGLSALLLLRVEGRQPFQTVAGPSGPATVRGRVALIAVGFVEAAPESAIRRTILGLGGTIVAGPSPLGLYTVAVPLPAEKGEELETLLQALREDRQVVRFAARQH